MNPKTMLAANPPGVLAPTIYYINLDHREDRRLEFSQEVEKLRLTLGEKPNVVRIPAIKHDVGAIGCGLSHCQALEMFLNSGQEHAIVMEDDYTFYDHMLPMMKEYLQAGKPPAGADCLLLAANLRQHEPHTAEFIRVRRSFTTSGYWLNRRAARELLRLWECSTLLHAVSPRQPEPKYCIDVAWWSLMETQVFLALTPLIGQIGHQRPSYSDIERREVNYLV